MGPLRNLVHTGNLMFFPIYLAKLDCGPLQKNRDGPQSKLAK